MANIILISKLTINFVLMGKTLPALKHKWIVLIMAQRGYKLHCRAEYSNPVPNFKVRLKHILSATSSQFFRYL
jgi:hypothetical protein